MAIPLGTTATNHQTGQKVVLTAQGWVPVGNQQMPLPEADQKAMENLHQQAQDAQYIDQMSQQFIRGMDPQKPGQGSFATGPALTDGWEVPFLHVDVPNPIHGYVNATDPRLGNLEGITDQTWVHLRPSGSGRMLQSETEGFQRAFPNVENYGQANQQIAARNHLNAQIATQKLAFIDNFIRSGNGDYAAANNAWQQAYGGNLAQQPPPVPAPMPMQPNPQSPLGYSPVPGQPPPANPTPQQQAILNWTPDKGLHP